MNERFFPTTGEAVRNHLERQERSIESIQTEEDVEAIAFEVLEHDEDAKYWMEQVQEARKSGRENEGAIFERKKLLDQIKIEVALISGVEIDAVSHAQQKEVYRNQIKDIITSLDSGLLVKEPSTKEESGEKAVKIMTQLGIIREVEGKRGFVFNFPSRIFPPYVQEQWRVYMDMVSQMEVAADKLRRGLISQTEFSGIDMMRGRAHNTVSQSIGDILEFDGWDLEDYRSFVAKMRDKKYDEQMGEISRYRDEFVGKFVEPEHLSVIDKAIRDFR